MEMMEMMMSVRFAFVSFAPLRTFHPHSSSLHLALFSLTRKTKDQRPRALLCRLYLFIMGCKGSKQTRIERNASERVAQTVVSSVLDAAITQVLSSSQEPSTALQPSNVPQPQTAADAQDVLRFKRQFSSQDTTQSNQLSAVENQEAWVHLTKEDNERIKAVHEAHPKFSKYELQRIFAAVKENGGALGREEFAMVYATCAMIQDHDLALRISDLFDKNSDGQVAFEELIPFLSVMLHGTIEEKAGYCFQVYDRNNDGYLSRDDLIALLSKLPIDSIMLEYEKTHPGAHVNAKQAALPGLTEEEDETEEGEELAEQQRKKDREAQEKRTEDERVREELVKSFRRSRNPLAEEEVPPNVVKAREIVNQIFSELGHEKNSITLQEFVDKVGESDTLKAFFPF
eukprot:m.17969 g.17969  ORF g.17969 m.17969 type:complete len:400 (-) comp8400_c0_seq1:150-1349(-)